MEGPANSEAHHTIRLRGPWDYQLFVDGQPSGPVRRSELDADWASLLDVQLRGVLRLVRRFSQPTNLEPDEQVLLVFTQSRCAASPTLNAQPLGQLPAKSDAAFDVTGQLSFRNDLNVELPWPLSDISPGSPLGEVRLEIRRVPA